MRSLLVVVAAAAVVAVEPMSLRDRVTTLTRASAWTLVASTPIHFRTFHPQGMVKIGDMLFVSSVEVIDRDAGRGIGHLFKLRMDGTVVSDLRVGEGSIYHPGGIDYDGRHIWVPVAEYRPDSRAIIYQVDPGAMRAIEIARVSDHIGAVVHDVDDDTLHGVSWGSRRFYKWTLSTATAAPLRTVNPSHYVDYQDCKYAGHHQMICTGVAELAQTAGGPPFGLGGLELVDLEHGRPLHQVPILLWTRTGRVMTQNPSWFDATERGLRAYFMPDDDSSTLYVYDAEAR